MSKRLCVASLSVSLMCLVLSSASAETLIRRYVEDFTKMRYCDMLNTTAWWDTVAGEVKLHPFQIALVGSYNTPGQALGVALSGDYACVADYNRLWVIDISDPTAPVPAGSYNTPGYAYWCRDLW